MNWAKNRVARGLLRGLLFRGLSPNQYPQYSLNLAKMQAKLQGSFCGNLTDFYRMITQGYDKPQKRVLGSLPGGLGYHTSLVPSALPVVALGPSKALCYQRMMVHRSTGHTLRL